VLDRDYWVARTKPDHYFLRGGIDLAHHGYLVVLLFHILFIDAKSIDPDKCWPGIATATRFVEKVPQILPYLERLTVELDDLGCVGTELPHVYDKAS
jgi:hypothetical protein